MLLISMPYRRAFFEKNQPVHIVSRAVEGLKIFNTKEDCYRLVFQFYAANVGRKNSNLHPKDAIKAGQALLWGEKVSSRFIIKEHPPLVDLLDFSLVINHHHFYLLPNVENIIPLDDWGKALDFLENFEFSSFPDRIGKRKSIILASEEILGRFPFGGNFKSQKEFQKFTKEFLKERSKLPHSYFLE